MLRLLTILIALSATRCAPNNPPILYEIGPKTAFVGTRLEFSILGADPDGDRLEFFVGSPSLGDIQQRSTLLPIGNEAFFSWTPLSRDAGQHELHFVVSDGDLTDLQAVPVTVKQGAEATAPVFRKPLGDGTTLDVESQQCLFLDVLVEDPDSPGVELHQRPPIDGSELTITGSHSAVFSWCPTPAQVAAKSHLLRLEANDHDNPPVYKEFTILIQTTP